MKHNAQFWLMIVHEYVFKKTCENTIRLDIDSGNKAVDDFLKKTLNLLIS